MAKVKDYFALSEKCEKQLWKMCKDRSQNHRKCVLPRCCGICPQILDCEGLCVYLKEKLKDDLKK